MELVHFFRAIWYRRWLLVIVPTSLAILVFFLTANLKKDYRSTARLSAGFTQKNQVSVEDEKIGRYEVEIKFSNLIEKMYSPNVMDLLTYSLVIHDLESSVPFRTTEDNNSELLLSEEDRLRIIGYAKDRLKSENMGEIVYETYRDDPVFKALVEALGYNHKQLIRNGFYLHRIDFSDYINVAATTENPKLSTFIVNEFCNLFIEYNNQLKARQSNESIKSLERLLASQQRELQELTKVLQDSLSKTSGFRSTPMESEISSQQLVNLQAEYNKLSLENKRLTLELERVNKKLLRKDRKNANVAARSRNEYYNKKYLEYRKKYQDSNFKNKMAEDSANYYLSLLAEVQTDVEHLNSEITLQEYKDLTEERDRIKVNLEINTTAYRQKGREIAQLRNLMKENEMHEGTFSELETRKKSAQDDYDRTNDRLRKELSKSRILGSSLKLDLFGYPPDKPEPSKRLLFVMASFFGGFVMLVGLIVLFELLDFSLKTSSIFQARTNLKLLGTFIFLDNLKGLGKRVLGVPQKGKVMHLDKFKELVRKTRFSIENEGKKLVLFTSCKPGVGKSFIIRALADAFVMKKKRVLIIDFNLKNNSLTEFFKPDKFIASKVLPNRKLVDFITKTHIRGVDFIGIEKSEMGLAELMGEDFLKSGFEQLRNMYDYVFVESANLNDFSDSMDLESCVDSVISIFSAQETLKFIDEQSILFLETLQDKYLGSILNRVEFRYVND